jgi:hypothetical protein
LAGARRNTGHAQHGHLACRACGGRAEIANCLAAAA